ncbi:Cna B-type domain-containing protein [Methanobrevibacter sp.]
MNKKLLTILFIAVFIAASVGFVSASDDVQDINVKISWDDAGSSERPDTVSVSLIHDGKVVKTAKLSASNSWSTTFENQDIDGSYSIKVGDISNYAVKSRGDAESGFVITAKINNDALLASDDESAVEQSDVSETQADGDTNQTGDDSNPTENISSENSTDKDTGNDTSADNKTDDSNSTEPKGEPRKETEETTDLPEKSTTGKTVTTKVVTTIVKETTPKKPVKANTTHTLKNTGLPVALVLVAIGAIFLPMIYRKR